MTSRTTLITLIFLSPALMRWTANSVCSSAAAAGAAAAPPPAAATITGAAAAAETPHFSSSVFTSSATWSTVRLLRSFAIA